MQEAADLAEGVHLSRFLFKAADLPHLRQQAPRQLGVELGRRRRGLGLGHEIPSSSSREAAVLSIRSTNREGDVSGVRDAERGPRPRFRYQRITFSSSTDNRRRTRKITTMIARPTATSAAATHMTKNTRACPSADPHRCPSDTSARLAALSISSMDMKMTSGSRRINTPSTPMLKSTAESATYQDAGTIYSVPGFRLASASTPTIATSSRTEVTSKGKR